MKKILLTIFLLYPNYINAQEAITDFGQESLSVLNDELRNMNRKINERVPANGIIVWSGTTANIPSGWAYCDGTLGTPDLSAESLIYIMKL